MSVASETGNCSPFEDTEGFSMVTTGSGRCVLAIFDLSLAAHAKTSSFLMRALSIAGVVYLGGGEGGDKVSSLLWLLDGVITGSYSIWLAKCVGLIMGTIGGLGIGGGTSGSLMDSGEELLSFITQDKGSLTGVRVVNVVAIC